MEFGKTILQFRAKHNLTQKQLAELFGVVVNTIIRYENNLSKPNAMHRIKFENIMKKWEEKENV